MNQDAVWRNTFKAEIVARGYSVFAKLEKSSTGGWKVRAWTRELGQARSTAEGTPIYEQNFGDFDTAYSEYAGLLREAIDNPGEYEESLKPVSRETQRAINQAVYEEEAIRVRQEVGG